MTSAVEKSGAFVASQFLGQGGAAEPERMAGPAITIAHQAGSGAEEIAGRLAEILQATEPPEAGRWAVLDRQVVERALEEHHWPRELARKMPEDKRSYVDDVLDDLFGLRPPSWVLVPQVAETILHLAEAGHVILLGRGATVVTTQLPRVFHVRLVASLASRVERVRVAQRLTAKAAEHLVKKEDRGRRRYVEANLHAHLEDDLLYHLVLNTDRIPCAEAAELIATAAKRCFAGDAGSATGPIKSRVE